MSNNNSKRIYIGMDLHKKTSSFCVMKHLGEILMEQTVQTRPEEIEAFIKKLNHSGLKVQRFAS